MKKVISVALILSLLFIGVFQNPTNTSAQTNLLDSEINEELQKYLEQENINFIDTGVNFFFSSTYNGIKYELAYYKAEGTYESKAYDIKSGTELNIKELEESQKNNGEVIKVPNKSNQAQPMVFPIILYPVAAWVFEHLIAMAIAATIVTVVAVTKDGVKAELEKRLKDKNPTIIYRGGSSTANNLTPRTKDVKGLSYFRKMPTGKFTATTKEAVNKTKVLKIILDKPNHASLTTVKASDMKSWIASKKNADEKPHKFTRILQAISVSSKN